MARDVPRSGHGLPNTIWSKIEAARAPTSSEGHQALDSLLTLYRPALVAHLRAKFKLSPEDAEDLFQTFVQKKVLGGNLLAGVDRHRGRFRTFLLSVLDHFAISERRRQQARKRTGEAMIPLDLIDDEELPPAPPADNPNPELFWAQAVIAGALLNMNNQCRGDSRPETWGIFVERLLAPAMADAEPATYQELVQRYHLRSPADAFNLLNTGKRMFRRHLQRVLADFAVEEGAVDDELAYLRRTLGPLTDEE